MAYNSTIMLWKKLFHNSDLANTSKVHCNNEDITFMKQKDGEIIYSFCTKASNSSTYMIV